MVLSCVFPFPTIWVLWRCWLSLLMFLPTSLMWLNAVFTDAIVSMWTLVGPYIMSSISSMLLFNSFSISSLSAMRTWWKNWIKFGFHFKSFLPSWNFLGQPQSLLIDTACCDAHHPPQSRYPNLMDWTINVDVHNLVFSNNKLSYLPSPNMLQPLFWLVWHDKGKEEVLVRGWMVVKAPWWACQTSWLCGECDRGGRESICRISVASGKNSLTGSLQNRISGVIIRGSGEMSS